MSPKAIHAQIKRSAFQKVKQIALQNDATIFGGYVRDEIIYEHNSNLFYRMHNMENAPISVSQHLKKYWDSNYMPSTKARLLIPKDIDISFSTVAHSERFIKALKKVPQFDAVVPRIVDPSYNSPLIFSITEVTILLKVGVIPFISDGKAIIIKVDIVIPYDTYLQPPFKNLDMLCNAFIMTKEGGKRLSQHTGTIIDDYTDYERSILSAKIMTDMLAFRTALVFSQRQNLLKKNLNLIAKNRIQKMHRRKFSWTFINAPFNTTFYKELIGAPSQCCICSILFNDDDNVVYADGVCFHYECCMKHLSSKIMDIMDFSQCCKTFHNVYQ